MRAFLSASVLIMIFLAQQTSAQTPCNSVSDCAQEAVEAARAAAAAAEFFNQLLPVGAVIAFTTEECPKIGWKEYAPAYGRFVRGIDKSGESIDPSGKREAGSLQEDINKQHTHTFARSGNLRNGSDDSGEQVGHPNPNFNTETKKSGGPESRPKNVALLYCERVQVTP